MIKQSEDKDVTMNTVSRSQLIETYMPFIIKQVASHLGRYVHSENDDALIVGMEAFDEALEKYNPTKGTFINFASVVIKSRMSDYLRAERKIAYHEHPEPPESLTKMVLEQSAVDDTKHNESVKDDFNQFKEYLGQFSITLERLTNTSPTHHKTRKELIALSIGISSTPEIVKKMLEKKTLPMSDILTAFQCSKKVLKTHRDFIIACIIIIHFDIDTIKNYLNLR